MVTMDEDLSGGLPSPPKFLERYKTESILHHLRRLQGKFTPLSWQRRAADRFLDVPLRSYGSRREAGEKLCVAPSTLPFRLELLQSLQNSRHARGVAFSMCLVIGREQHVVHHEAVGGEPRGGLELAHRRIGAAC